MRWISSEGGPLLILPEAALKSWNGCSTQGNRATAPNGGKTDYDRACEVSDYTGIIPVGTAEALVLGEHMQTTWIPMGENGGMIVQWLYADDEPSVIRALASVPSNLFRPTGFLFHVSTPVLYLFDSAIAGKSLEPGDALIIQLKAGDYQVETGSYNPDEHTALVIHRLLPA